MLNVREKDDCEETLKYFDLGKIRSFIRIDSGIVNLSYYVETSRGRFVLQRLNPVFDERVIEDFSAVESYLRTNDIRVPVLVASKKGKVSFNTEKGLWRVFEYIPHDEIDKITPDIAYEAGKIIGRFHELMKDYDFKPRFKFEGFHDTPRIISKLEGLMNDENCRNKSMMVNNEFEFITRNVRKHYLPEDRDKTIIHGDPKIANFLFRDGKCVALLDLDTMMFESGLIDMGDMLRSWCKDKNFGYQPDIFREVISGYVSNSSLEFSSDDLKNSMSLITLELASRYLVDYFDEKYFSWDDKKYNSPAENHIDRCRSYLEYYRSFYNIK